MQPKQVRHKNRKLRRLQELYPDVNIKVFYQRDFRNLLLKYGISVEERPHAAGGGLAPADEDPNA